MAWIESHQELRNHPKTKRLARLLNISIAAAIGHLHMFWWWAMDYADNGDVSQYDPEDIADAGGWEGDAQTFLDAMINCGPGNRCGFIDRAENGMYIHDWDEYIGKLLERRQRNKESVHKSRNKNVGDTLATCNANVTPTNENVGDTLEATVPNRTVPTVPNQPNQQIKDTTQHGGDGVRRSHNGHSRHNDRA